MVVRMYLVMMAMSGGVREAPMNRAKLWCLVFFRMETYIAQRRCGLTDQELFLDSD